MKRHNRIAATAVAAVMLLASCGGGDSSGRTRNAALCYENQEAKDAAVQLARVAFEASLGNTSTDETPEESPEETPTSVDEETPTSVEEETSTTVEEGAFGGGYRRPAVRAASSGDATVPADEEGVLTPEQQQLQMDLENAEAQPLCEPDAESTSEVTCTATRTFEGVTDDCADGDVIVEDSNGGEWKLVNFAEDGSETILANGTYDVTTLGVDNPIIISISYVSMAGEQSEEEFSEDVFAGVFTPSAYYRHDPVVDGDTIINMSSGRSCEEAPFSVYWFESNGVNYEFSSVDEAWDQDGLCTYFYSGNYSNSFIHYVDSVVEVGWESNVNFSDASESDLEDGEEIKTPFEYTFESASVRYSFELTEVTEVRITGNTFMSCEGRNEIVPDPEMTLSEGFGSNLDEIADADNNYSDSDGNCSAAEIYEELESGQYVLDVINDDYDNPSERGTITIRSSIELVEVVRDWSQINLRNESVNPPKFFDVTIPEGGALFVATADSSNSDEQCENAGDDDNPLTYVDPYIILINKSTGAMIYSDDDGENIGLPCYSSYLELEVDGGEYLFIATTYALAADDGDYTDGEIAGTYALEFGVSGSEVPEDVVIEESTEPAPPVEIPAPPALPVGQLVEPGSKGTVQIADGVTSMVCTSTCIDELFAAVDPSVSSLQVAIGKNTVELKRNSKKAVVAVEAGSRSVNVVAISDTGVETKVLTGQVQIGEPEVTLGANSGDSGSSFNWLILVIIGLIVAAGAGVVVSRRSKTA
jgi:hypothetical protein